MYVYIYIYIYIERERERIGVHLFVCLFVCLFSLSLSIVFFMFLFFPFSLIPYMTLWILFERTWLEYHYMFVQIAPSERAFSNNSTYNLHLGLINAPPLYCFFFQATFFSIHLLSKRPDIY